MDNKKTFLMLNFFYTYYLFRVKTFWLIKYLEKRVSFKKKKQKPLPNNKKRNKKIKIFFTKETIEAWHKNNPK